VQLTRGQADSLHLTEGAMVWLRSAPGASTLAEPAAAVPVPAG
jgi:hypothetical protein